PSGTIVPPTTPQQEVKVSASNFVFPTIPGELPVSEKLPVISDNEEAAFDTINPVMIRQDTRARSCFGSAQGFDETSLMENTELTQSRCDVRLYVNTKKTSLLPVLR
ncbi:hypothetical protein, partial [Bordetella avium]